MIYLNEKEQQICELYLQGIKNSDICKHSDCSAYKLRIDKKEDSEKLYKFLYKIKIPCLSRKLNNFEALYGNI